MVERKMKYKSLWSGIELLDSDYNNSHLVIAKETLFKETLAIKDTEKYIYVLINDESTEFYSIIEKNGLNSLAFNTIKVGLGTLAGTLSSHYAGGRTREKLIFIKLKNGKRILLIVEEGYSHMIRCTNKRNKDEIDKNDIQWIKQALEKNEIELLTVTGKPKNL